MKKIYVTWGGWDGHDPEQTATLMTKTMREEGHEVDLTTTLDDFLDKEKMAGYDLIVPVWTMSEITKEQLEGLLDTVSEGTGLAGWHGGMCDAFRQNTNYQYMCGGQWVEHPGGVIDYTVNIVDHDDPVTAGLSDFAMHSEQYYMHTDPGNKVLATTTFTGRHGGTPWIKDTVMPVTWQRMWGKGRVAYTSLGHVASDFDVPEALEMTKRNILWAARQRITTEYRSK